MCVWIFIGELANVVYRKNSSITSSADDIGMYSRWESKHTLHGWCDRQICNNSFFPNHTPCLVSDFRGPFSIKFDISFDVPRWLESLMAHWPDSTFYECAHLESPTFTCHCPFPASQSIASGTWLQLGAAMDQARLGWAASKPIRFIWFASVQLYKKLDTEPTRLLLNWFGLCDWV